MQRSARVLVRALGATLPLLVCSCEPSTPGPSTPLPEIGELVAKVQLRGNEMIQFGARPAVVAIRRGAVCIASPTLWSREPREKLSEPARPVIGQLLSRMESAAAPGANLLQAPGLVIDVDEDEIVVARKWRSVWVNWRDVVFWETMSESEVK